jgi:hypothetical protein
MPRSRTKSGRRPAGAQGGAHVLGEHDGGGGTGGGDQEVGVGEGGGHIAGPQLLAVDSCGHLGGSLLAAAGH